MLTAHDIARRRATVVTVLRLAALGLVLQGVRIVGSVALYSFRYLDFSQSHSVQYMFSSLMPAGWWIGVAVFFWWLGPWLASRIVPATLATTCPRCGFDLIDARVRCNECGLRLATSPEQSRPLPASVFRARLCVGMTASFRAAGLLITLGFVLLVLYLVAVGWESPIQLLFRNEHRGRHYAAPVILAFAYLLWPFVGALLFFRARWLARLLVFGWPRRRPNCV